MTPEEPYHNLSRIVFVLDRPREAMNVGAVVRLMGNFGLARLRLVEPAAFDPHLVSRMARRGERVVLRLERFASLPEAIADCGLVLGTTRRSRAVPRPVWSPAEAADYLLAEAATDSQGRGASGLSAVIFGPEDFGLSNAALDHCHAIVTIPTVPDDASLNLAQAALIIAYEVFLAATTPRASPAGRLGSGISWPDAGLSAGTAGFKAPLARSAELERLFAVAYSMLQALHTPPIEGRTNAALARLRALLLRAGPRQDEVAWLQDLFEHIARLRNDAAGRDRQDP
jgi:TrmH family RNA methyltransferase